MPELPEVETVRRGLEPYLENAVLSQVQLYRPNLRYPFPDRFAERLDGATVLRLERRAKYLLFHMNTQDVWVTHLGMTGRFQVEDRAVDDHYYHAVEADKKHRHFSVVAEKQGKKCRIDFYDPRRFGFMLLMTPDELYSSKWFQGLGLEPLSDAFDGNALAAMARGKKTNLKALLMAQGGIAGLGNIYVCEALWRAKLGPERAGGSLSKGEFEALAGAVKGVLREAIGAGGSSISDFAAATGELGYFQHNFCVYDRKGQPCRRDDGGIIARKVHQGRSTFYCPVCQV